MSGRRINENKGQASKAHARLDPVTRRALLVEAAAEVFRGRDPNDVGFEEVAEAAGVSRSLVYAYFGDRGGLSAAVYLHELELLDAELGKGSNSRLPDDVRLRRIVRRYLLFARDHQDIWNSIMAMGSLPHPAIQEARLHRIKRLARAWDDGPTTEMIVRSVVGFLEAGVQHWVDTRQFGLERASKELYSMLSGGLVGMRARVNATSAKEAGRKAAVAG